MVATSYACLMAVSGTQPRLLATIEVKPFRNYNQFRSLGFPKRRTVLNTFFNPQNSSQLILETDLEFNTYLRELLRGTPTLYPGAQACGILMFLCPYRADALTFLHILARCNLLT